MPNDNEMKKPKVRFDTHVDRAMADSYGEQLVNQLYVLLSDAAFYDDIEALRKEYDIVPLPEMDDLYHDMHIAEAVHRKTGGKQPKDEAERLQTFIDAISVFDNSIVAVMRKHGVSLSWKRLLKMYIARGELTPLQSIKGIIRTEMDQKTKELTIRLSPEARKVDLSKVLPIIYKAWGKWLPPPTKSQPVQFAKRDAEMTRYYERHEIKATVAKYGTKHLDYDAILKAVGRMQEKRATIKLRTPFNT